MISYIRFTGKAGREATVEKAKKGWNVLLYDPKNAKVKGKFVEDGRQAEKMANGFVERGRMPKYLRTPLDLVKAMNGTVNRDNRRISRERRVEIAKMGAAARWNGNGVR